MFETHQRVVQTLSFNVYGNAPEFFTPAWLYILLQRLELRNMNSYLPSLSTSFRKLRKWNLFTWMLFLVLFSTSMDKERIGRHLAPRFSFWLAHLWVNVYRSVESVNNLKRKTITCKKVKQFFCFFCQESQDRSQWNLISLFSFILWFGVIKWAWELDDPPSLWNSLPAKLQRTHKNCSLASFRRQH